MEHRATVRVLALTVQRALAARQDAKQLEAELRQLVTVMARPCSASPASALSVPHRVNRGGDRQLNRGLPTIVMLRQVHHGPTRAYTSRRIAQELYRLLERTATTEPGRRVDRAFRQDTTGQGSDGHNSGP